MVTLKVQVCFCNYHLLQVENTHFILEYFSPEGPTPPSDADDYDPEVGKARGIAFGGWVAKWADAGDWSMSNANKTLRYRRQGYLRSEDVSAKHPICAAAGSWQALTDNGDENPTIDADWDKPHEWKCEKAPRFCRTPDVSIRIADKAALDAADTAHVYGMMSCFKATRDAAACPIHLSNAGRYLGNQIFTRWYPVRVGGKLKRSGNRFVYGTNKKGKYNPDRCIEYDSQAQRYVNIPAPLTYILYIIYNLLAFTPSLPHRHRLPSHLHPNFLLILTPSPSFVFGWSHTGTLASLICPSLFTLSLARTPPLHHPLVTINPLRSLPLTTPSSPSPSPVGGQ